MTVRLNLTLPDELDREMEAAAAESETTKSDVFRKALQLYVAAHKGAKRGLIVGLVNRESRKIETEFVGL